MKPLSDDSLIARVLTRLANIIVQRRRLFLYPQLVLCVLCALYTAKYLQFDMSRNDLVGAKKKYHQNFLKFKKEFPTQDDLVVVVESEDEEKNRQFVERLGARLEAETNLFHDIIYRGDLKLLGSKALQFLSRSNLLDFKKMLDDYQPFIKQFTHTTNLVSLFTMVNTQFRTAKAEKNAENESLVKAIPALERIVTQATDSLRRSGTPPSPGVTALFDPSKEAQQEIYITFEDGRIYLLTAQAPTEDLNDESVDRLRHLVDEIKTEVPGLNVGVTGEPVLEHDEMAQSEADTSVASVVSLVLCALIFIYGYQETGRPVKATLCLIVGLSYTMAFTTAVVHHLNILTITFAPILIGLAIDYGVHLISRYEEELRRGKTEKAALARAMVYTGQGIFTGAFTTAGAFLAMTFTDFKGIQEMGIICGGGLLICLVPMMTMLPALLLRGRQNIIDHEQKPAAARRARIENLWLQRPIAVTIVTIVLSGLALTQLPKVYFDYDLLKMQSEGLPSVIYAEKLARSTNSVLYAAVITTNVEQAISWEQQITNMPAVAKVESITRFLAENQRPKLPIISQLKQDLAPIHFDEPDRRPADIQALSRTLYYLYGYLGLAADEAQKDDPAVSQQLSSLRRAVDTLRVAMKPGNPTAASVSSQKLALFQQALFDDVRETFRALQHQDDSSPLGIEDLPSALRDRFIGVTGKYLLMVYPKKDVWKRENQKELLDQLRTLDPNVTGSPVQFYEYVRLLKDSYETAAWYALIAIAILVFIHFRGPLPVSLALVPVAIGFIWLGGLMGWLGIPLNPANIMTLPLVIGIGVTNGIHILNRYAEEQTPNILARSTGKAVLVSGLTAIAGFGSLILAKHRGIQSLGYVMSTGIATCMIAGLTFLPALLNLLSRRSSRVASEAEQPEVNGTKQPSANNALSTLGQEEPR
jgi:hopanoid biosynthesis associated RND transporter like protein HpnN